MPWFTVFAIVLALCVAPPAIAEDTVCARVKIEIKQELTLERQAFEAEMKINNTTDTGVIEDVGIVVKVTDEDGTPVAVSGNPNDLSARFFLRVSNQQNIDDIDGAGTVNPRTTSTIDWLLIPAPGAAGSSPLGKKYLVGATLTYTFGGERTTLDVSPDVITVKPLPLLTLDYFLPRDVYADDPLTPEIEPAEPFTLGVRVRNDGLADANQLKIDSAQPRIIENQQGLLINFVLTGSYLDDAPAQNTLLIDFGTIAAGRSRMGRWNMETTLAGRFTEFTARFSHADALGGAMTSLLKATQTHTLIHDVRADLPGRDGVHDFLAQDGDVVRVYESDGPDTEVTDRSGVASLAAAGGGYRLTLPATAGFVYARLADPFRGAKVIGQVLRTDGKALAADNVWLSRTRNPDTKQWEYWFNLFDANTPGGYDTRFDDPPDTPHPPVLQFIPNRSVQEKRQVSFLVEASSPDGKPVTLSAVPLPFGARLTSQPNDPAAPTVARAIFDWKPPRGTAGDYLVVYTASDGNLSATRAATLSVTAAPVVALPPAAHNDAATTRAGVALTLPVLANDALGVGASALDPAGLDLDSGTPEVEATRTLPGAGVFTRLADGRVRFAPVATFSGVATVSYRMRDNLGQWSNRANLSITVTGPAHVADTTVDRPAANDDDAATLPETPLSIDVAGNDVAGPGANLDPGAVDLDTATAGTQASRVTAEGTWTAHPDGSVLYAPAAGFGGIARLDYAIADEAGRSAGATISVAVLGGAEALARDDRGATLPNTAAIFAVLDNDAASTGGEMAAETLDLDTATDGLQTLRIAAEGIWETHPDGTLSFTPTADFAQTGRPFTGTASLTYGISDSNGRATAASVSLVVNPTQTSGGPTATDDTADTAFATPVSFAPAANDHAAPGAVLAPATLDLDPATEAIDQYRTTADGTWRIRPDATVSFTPAATFTGSTAPQAYRIRDSLGNHADATMTVRVAPPGGLTVSGRVFHDLDRSRTQTDNEPGTAAGGLYVTAITPAGQAVATAPVSGDGHYSLPVSANTAYTLVLSTTADGPTSGLPAGWSHTGENSDGVADAADDGRLLVNVSVYSLTGRNFGIRGADPVAHDDLAATPHGSAVDVAVLDNDTQGPGGRAFVPDTLDLDPVADGVQRVFLAAGIGNFTADPATGKVRFAPLPTFVGSAPPVAYRVADDLGRLTNSAAIRAVVGPDANDDRAETAYATRLIGSLASNDLAPGDAIFTVTDLPDHGSVTVDPDGGYSYQPATGYSGPDRFGYRVCLAAPHEALCDSATLNLSVAAPVLPPELRLQQHSSSDQPTVGQPFTYALTISNSGGATTEPARIVDTLPAGVRLTGVAAPGWTCQPAVTAAAPLQGGNGATLACTHAGPIAGEPLALRLTAVPTAIAGSYVNQVTLTGDGQTPDTAHCDGSAAANCDQSPITPRNPRLELTETLTLLPGDEAGAADGRVQEGESLTYTWTLTNRGDVPLSPVGVSDGQLAEGSLNCAARTAQGRNYAPSGAGNGLAVGDAVTCGGRHIVTAAEAAAGRVENTATAMGRAPDGTALLAEAAGVWENRLPGARVSLALTAQHLDADGNGRFDQGETVAHGYVLRNIGNEALADVGVTDRDPLWPPIACPPGALDVGVSRTCAATDAVLGVADETAERMADTATATGITPAGQTVTAIAVKVLHSGQSAGLNLQKQSFLILDADHDGALSVGDTVAVKLLATNTGALPLTELLVTDGDLGAVLKTAGACNPPLGSTLNPGQQMDCAGTTQVRSASSTPWPATAAASGRPVGRWAPVDASAAEAVPVVHHDAGAAPLYAVGDRVWLDANGDGIQQMAEAGIDGVAVRLQQSDGSRWTAATYLDGGAVPDQVTANGGYYRFGHLPNLARVYRVQVLTGNFLSDLTGTRPLYAMVSSYGDDGSAFPWPDGRDQGLGSAPTAASGIVSRGFDFGALPSGNLAYGGVDFGFGKTATTGAAPDLVITQTANVAAINPGGSLTLTLRASNAVGAGALTKAPVVLETLPSGLTVAGVAATLPATQWSCTVAANRRTVTCIYKGALPVAGGGELGGAIGIPVTVGSTLTGGEVTLAATITKMPGEPSFTNNAANLSLPVGP